MDSQRLIELNEKLSNLEKTIKKRIIKFHSEIINQKNIINEIIDFEMDLEIDFYNLTGELITQYHDSIFSNKLKHWQFDDGKNHNDFVIWENHKMFGQKQCWLFHSLYDHLNLTIEQILTIEDIGWDINISYQYGNEGFKLNGCDNENVS